MGFGRKIKERIRNDPNFIHLGHGVKRGLQGIRAGAGTYFAKKLPIAQWITGYQPRWLVGDVTAGLSVALLLIPQASIYSLLTGLDTQQILLSSWLPGFVQALMGTSRDISVGPTTLVMLFIRGLVVTLAEEGGVPPFITAPALAFVVGLWSLIFGFLNLGFFFEFISIPMFLGFVFGVSFIVTTFQFPVLLGIEGIENKFMTVVPDIITRITETNLLTVAVGGSSIIILLSFQLLEKKFGHLNVILRSITRTRFLLVPAIYTVISYFVNQDEAMPLWRTLGSIRTTIQPVKMPAVKLVQSLLLPGALLFLTSTVEHIAMARIFGKSGGYKVDHSQEMVALGFANIANAFFGGVPVGGGDMARTSVNAGSGVRSPLSGVVVSTTVLISIYTLSTALKFLPMATVGAVILVSIFDQMPPQALILKYWRTSFVDFVTLNIVLNGTILATGSAGIGASLVFIIIYTIIRFMFSRPTTISSLDLENQYSSPVSLRLAGENQIPPGTQILKLETDVLFWNAERVKRYVVDTVMKYQSGVSSVEVKTSAIEQPWNANLNKYISDLRRKAGINATETFLPRIRVVILDLSSTSFIDTTAVQAFEDMKREIREYGGESVRFRWVGLNRAVENRFKRARWNIGIPFGTQLFYEGENEAENDYCFDGLMQAIQWKDRGAGGKGGSFGYEDVEMVMSKMF